MRKEKLRLMVKVCQLYYQEGYNQQDISRKYGISRPQVSRLISAARIEGIVEINIRNPFVNEASMEKEIMKHFHLKDAIIVDTSDLDEDLVHTSLGRAGSIFFESVIKKSDVVGVMAGKSIASLIKEADEIQTSHLHIVPLVGGWGVNGMNWHANANVTELAKKAKGDYWVLHAPAIVSSVQMRTNLINEPSIRKVLEQSRNANIALVGIGEITENATFFQSMHLSNEELKEITDEGAVGSIGTIFVNRNGEQVGQAFSDRMIGITGNELKEVPLVIGIANGLEKTEAITAILKGGWIDVLITDITTAKQLLKNKK